MLNRIQIRRVLSLTALSLTLFATGCATKVSDSVVSRITTTDATRLHSGKKSLFIDARPSTAYGRGHITGAINMRFADLSYSEQDPELTSRSTLVVYGENPGSPTALALAKRLISLKYKGVVYYEPGLDGWRNAGLPIENQRE
jgi:rhodanese-related sulfurtransferase